jgi:hypothetical protein
VYIFDEVEQVQNEKAQIRCIVIVQHVDVKLLVDGEVWLVLCA